MRESAKEREAKVSLCPGLESVLKRVKKCTMFTKQQKSE